MAIHRRGAKALSSPRLMDPVILNGVKNLFLAGTEILRFAQNDGGGFVAR
jgi:hypothetical protein